MPVSTWFRQWLERRRRKATPSDPLAPFAQLSVRRLEDRRVLSATLTSGLSSDVVVDVTGTDTVTLSVDANNDLIITDTDGGTSDIVIDLDTFNLDSLTINADAGNQDIVFAGANLIPVADLTITSNGGTDSVAFQQNVLAAEGGISINVTGDVTVAAGVSVSSTDAVSGAIDIDANSVVMDAGSSLTSTNFGIDISAADDVTVQQLDAGLDINLTAGDQLTIADSATSTSGGMTLDGTTVDVNAAIQSDGTVSITADNDVTFSASGDVTVADGNLTIAAGADATDDVTMADGATFDVTSAGGATVSVTAGGDIAVSEITGANLDGVTLAAGGSIADSLAAETANVTADTLAMTAGSGIGVGDDLNTTVLQLEAITATGGIVVTESDALQLGGVTAGLNGVDVTGASGGIAITAAGTITVTEGVSGSGDVTLAATGSASDLTIALNSGVSSTGGDITLAADRTVTISENVTATGAGTITVTGNAAAGARNILVDSGAVVSVVDGDLLLDADQGITQLGDFSGIVISNATLETTGTGDITLVGRGGDDGGTANHAGIVLTNGAVMQSTAMGATAGTITLTGTGGDGPSGNYGVLLAVGATITTVDGDIAVIGVGGGDPFGTSDGNIGVYVANGAQISSTGTGTDAATITLTGTGGTGSGSGHIGLLVAGAGTTVTSVDGDIELTGQGGGTGSSGGNRGIAVGEGAVISSTGTTADAATITLDGAGGSTTGDSNLGVFLTDANTLITSVAGMITITGTGGGSGASGLNAGLQVINGAQITSTGTGPTAAAITLAGTGGGGSGSYNIGVSLDGPGAVVTTVDGNILITGLGGGTGGSSHDSGLVVSGTAQITSTGTGSITLEGSGGSGTGGQNHGVLIDGAGSVIASTAGGDIHITGSAGGDPASLGIALRNGATISTNNAADITLVADRIEIDGAATINAGAQTVTLETAMNGTAIDLGGNDSGSALGLTDAELDRITAGTLIIGNANSGAITVSDDITLNPVAVATLCLMTAATVTTTTGSVTAQNLSVSAGGSVQFTTATNDVDTLAIATTSGDVAFVDSDGLTIATVCGIAGVSTVAGNAAITASNGAIAIGDGGGQGIAATGAVTLAATAGITDAAGSTITAIGLELLGSGDVVLDNAHDVDRLSTDLDGSLTFVDADGFEIGTAGGTTGITLGPAVSRDLSLTATTGAIAIAADVSTTGSQTYNSAVLIAADVTLGSTGVANITFVSTVQDDGLGGTDSNLAVSTAGTTTFGDEVGGSGAALTSLSTDAAGSTVLTSDVTTVDGQTFGDAVTLAADVTLTSTNGQDITLGGTVNGDGVTDRAFTVTTAGTTTFADDIGGTFVLASLTVDGGGTTDLAGNVSTIGDQQFDDDVRLLDDVTLNSSAGNITFAGTLEGTFALSITNAVDVTFAGNVGATDELVSLDVNASGTVTVAGDMQLGEDGTNIGTVTIFAGTFILTGSIDTQDADAFGGGGVLILASDIQLGGAITTDEGNVDFNGPVTLTAATTIDTESGSVAFLDTLDGNGGGESLTVTSTAGGTVLFTGAVGNAVALGDVTVNTTAPAGVISIQNGITSQGTVTLTAESVQASGDIDTTLGSGGVSITSTLLTVLDGDITTGSGDITLAGFTRLDTSVTLTTSTGDVTITGFLDSNDLGGVPVDGLTIAAGGDVTIAADVGTGTTPGSDTDGLAFLTITAGGDIIACGNWIIDDALAFTSSVILCGDLTITATGNVTFGGTVDGDGIAASTMLAINTAGLTDFQNAVGGTVAITSLTTDAGGSTQLAADVTTDGTQTYGDAVVLTGNAVLSSQGAGPLGNITFDGTVDGPHSLTVNTAGVTSFNDRVGDNAALTTLHTDAAGTTVLNTDVVTAAGVQFDDPVSVDVTTTVTGATSVAFGQTVAGVNGDESLTVVSTGAATFGGAVSNLVDVTVNADGTTTFAGDVAISGDLTTNAAGLTKIDTAAIAAATVDFNDAVELCQDLLVTAGDIRFDGTLNEAIGAAGSNLTLTITAPATGDVTFTDAVGGTIALDSLTITTANDVTFASTVRTIGDVDQQAGTGTTAFNGTSGAGIGGQLLITTDTVTFSTADVVAVGAVVIAAQNAITFNTSAGLNATAATITLQANQDGVGGQGLTQASGTVIQTTNDILIEVGGTGDAALSDVRAVGGIATVTVGGAITDNSVGEAANITAAGTALTAVSGIGGAAAADLDTAVDHLEAVTNTGGITIQEADAITIGGVTGSLSGLDVLTSGDITVTAGGAITVIEQVAGPDDIMLSAGGTLTINAAVTTAAGDIRLVADSMDFGAGADIDAGTNIVTLVQQTDGTQINLGGADAAGVLGLTNAELDTITAGELHIGDANTGAVTVSADIDLTNNTPILCIETASSVTGTAGGLQVTNLAVTAGGAVTLTDPQMDVDNVAITTTSGNVAFTDADGFTVTTVCSVNGVSTAAGSVALTATTGDVTIANTAAAADVSATTGITITLAANDSLFTIASNANVQTAAGGVTVSADKMNLGGSITATGQTVTLKNSVGADAIDLGSAVDVTADTLELSDAELDRIASDKLVIGSATMGAITVSADLFLANNATILHLVTGSTVTATAGGVVVNNLAVTAGGAVTFTDGTTNVVNLAIDTSTGDVLFTEANGLIVTTVGGVTGIDTDLGSITIQVTLGSLTIANTAAANDLDATTGITIALAANDAPFTIAAGADLETAAGGVTISADKMALGGTITATGQTVTLKNSVGADAINLGSTVDTTANTLELSDAELDRITSNKLVIGSTTTGAVTVSADLFLTNNASILRLETGAGVTATAGGIVVANLAIEAAGTVNFTDGTTDVDALALVTTAGSATFTDADNLTIGTVDGLAGLTTAGGDVTLTTNGLLTLGSGLGEDLTAAGATVCIMTGTGGMTEQTGSVITAANLYLTGAGDFTLGENNDINVLAAQLTGAGRELVFVDGDELTIGTVCGFAGISTTSGNVTLTTGGLITIGTGAGQDIAAGTGIVTLNTASGGVVELAGSVITANGLRLLGAGVYTLNQQNDVATFAADVDGTVAYTDANALAVGTVTGTTGITTTDDDVKLTTGGNLVFNDDVNLGVADLTLNVTGSITQTAGDTLTARGLQLLGTGTVTLNDANDVDVLAANRNGTIAFTDIDDLIVGTVTDNPSAMTTAGITTSSDDVKLTTGGNLTLNDDVTVGIADLTLAVTGAVTQTAGDTITARGLQLLGTGTVTLNEVNNDIDILAASYNGTIAYTDLDDLTVGAVTDNPSAMTTAGITTSSDDVKLTTGSNLTLNDDVALGVADLTLDVIGAVMQTAGDTITARGLQLLGTGTVTLNEANDVDILAANYNGTIAFTDGDNLAVGTVTDDPSATTTAGIVTTDDDVKLTAGGNLAFNDDVNLGLADLMLNVTGNVTQTAGDTITARGLQLLGTGTVTLNDANDVDVIAANYNGAIAFTDGDNLAVGTVTDDPSGMTTAGITTSADDVKLTTGGNLTLNDDVILGVADLTLNVTGSITQTAGDTITVRGLQLLGVGTITLNEANDVDVLAAAYNGTIAFTDVDNLAIGTVTDEPSAMTTAGLTTSADDVKLTAGGNLAINDDVNLGVADLTLNVTGPVTQTAGDVITARGLQLLGAGTVTLNDANNVDVIAANHNGTIAFTDVDNLAVGTVTDDSSGMTTAGITTSADDVKLMTGGNLTLNDDVTLGIADLTLDVTGAVAQTAGDVITARGLQLLGAGTVTLTDANDVDVIAANYNGAIAFTDVDNLTVGTVTDNPSAMTTAGIATSDDDVTLTTGGLLTVGTGVGQDISVGAAVVTLNTTAGGVLEAAGSIVTADSLLLTGTGTYTLAQANEVNTLAADVAGDLTFVDGDDLEIGTVAATGGISTGNPTAGGDVTITAAGDLTVNQSINTQGGSGGVVTVSGGTLNAALVAGAGDITLTGGNQDLVINVAQTTATTVTYQANRDVIINATVATTGPGSDVIVTADLDSDGSGGVQVTATGQVNSADAIVLSGSDLFATAGSQDSVRIDADGINDQLLALGDITLQHRAAAPVGADIVIDGRIHSTTGDVVVNARNIIRVQSVVAADAGDVMFQDAAVLTDDLLVTAGGAVTFQQTVNDDGAGGTTSNLVVTAAGATTFATHVGNVAAIDSLTTDGGSVTNFCGNVTTVNDQTYVDAVILCANTITLTSTAVGDIAFQSTVDSDAIGPRNLVVNTAGITDFQGAVGGTRALATLTTNAGGTTQIGGGLIRTTGPQTYNDDVALTADALLETVAATANGADITVAGTVQTGGFDLTLDAGTQGDLTLQAATTGGGTITVLRGDVQQFAVVTVDEFIIQSATTSVTLHGPVTVTNNVTVTSGGTITQESIVNAGLDVTYTATGAISIQDDLTAGSDVTLTSTAASITSTGPITATAGNLVVTAATTFSATDALTAATSVVITTTGGTTLSATADVCTTAVGGFVTITGALTTAADILTNDGTITLTGPVLLTGDVTWDSDRFETGGAAILVQGTLATAGNDLTVDAGANGDLTFQAALTGGGDLTVEDGDAIRFEDVVQVANLTILDATTSVTFVAAVTVINNVAVTSGGTITQQSTLSAGNDVTYTATGAIAVQGDLTAGSDVSLTSTASSIMLTGPVTATTGNLSVDAGTSLAATQALTAAQNITLTSGSSTNLTATVTATAGNLTATAGTAFNATQPLSAGTDVTITSGAATTVSGAITAGDDISITSTAGSVGLSGQVVANDDVTISSATFTTLTATVTATTGTIDIDAGTSLSASQTLTAQVDVDIDAGTSLTLTAPVTATSGDIVATAGTTLSATQLLTAGDQISLVAGSTLTLAETADLVAGVGGVVLTGPQINTAAEITTASGDVAITGAVTLTGDVTIDTGAAGNVLVTGTIDAQTAFIQSLILSTGSGDITITGNVGSTTALNDVVVTDANGVTFGAAITADTLLQQSGTGVTTIGGAVNTFGTGGIQLTTTTIQFAAGTSSMDSHGNIIVLTADAITLPTTFTNATGSTVTLQTLTAGTSIGLEDASQDLNFTDAQLDTIHAANLVIGSATQTAGISVGGAVSQDENLTLLTAGSISVSGALSATTSNTVLLDAGNEINVTGSIAVLSGNLTLAADDDLAFGAAALVQSTSGDVLLLADANGDANGTGGGITMADGAVANAGTGTLTLLADESIVIGQLISSNTTANAIAITTQTGGVIDAGDAGGADIVVTNSTGVVTIQAVTGVGSAAGGGTDAALETQINRLAVVNGTSGAINIDEIDAITFDGVEQNGPGSVTLTAGGTMTVAAGGPGVQTQGGDIALVTTGATSNLVLLAPITSRGGDVTITVGGDLSEGVAAPIATMGGDLTATVGSDATFAGAVSTSGGDIALTTGDNLSQAGTAPMTTAGGDLMATVGGDLSLAASTTTAGGDVSLNVTGNTNFTATGAIATANGDFAATVGGNVVMANGAVVNTSLGTISLVAGGDITLGQLITTNATSSAVLVRSTGGELIDGGDAGGADIVANSAGAIVTIETRDGVGTSAGSGADAAIETQVDTLVLRNSAAGNVSIDEADGLKLLELTQSATGSVTVNAVGNLVLVGGNPGVTATSGTVTLSATGTASNVTIDSKIQTTSGDVAVNAANSMMMGAAASILSTSGDVVVTADSDGNDNGAGGNLFMADGAVINAGSGNVTLKADGNITVGRVITTSTATFVSTSGGVVDGGDAGGADIVANAVAFQTTTGIGAANALETSVSTLAAVNSTSGAIKINNNTGGLLTIGMVGAVTGITNNGPTAAVIDVVNNGGITVNGAVGNNTGGDIVLAANNSGDLTVNAAIAAKNGSGDVLLTAGDDLLLNDTSEDVDISVQNGGEVLGTAGGDVIFSDDFVVQSATGQVAGIPPVLIDVTTPQISALGEGTITLTTQRPLEVGTVIVIDWGDGTTETFVVTEPGTQTLTFTHTYAGPPNPADPAADIPIAVTVLTPGFTTGATTSPTDGTVQVDNGTYVPNIRFSADGVVLGPSDVGVLNQTLFTGVFKTPGEGLASFIFDTTPEVQLLAFPEAAKLDAALLAVPQPPNTTNIVGELTVAAEDMQAEDRVVVLEVIGPDGQVMQTVILSEDVLDDIDGVIHDLPDGRYRFSLREPGESQTRLLQDVEVRQGKIADDSDATRDRPPSLKRRPAMDGPMSPDETSAPADALDPENPAVEEDMAEPVAMWSSWRAKHAFRQAVQEAADDVAADDVEGNDVDVQVAFAAAVAPAVLTRPVRSAFRRTARLLRKYGAE